MHCYIIPHPFLAKGFDLTTSKSVIGQFLPIKRNYLLKLKLKHSYIKLTLSPIFSFKFLLNLSKLKNAWNICTMIDEKKDFIENVIFVEKSILVTSGKPPALNTRVYIEELKASFRPFFCLTEKPFSNSNHCKMLTYLETLVLLLLFMSVFQSNKYYIHIIMFVL